MASTEAIQPGGTTIVASIASTIAGPGRRSPGIKPSRQCTGQAAKPVSGNHTWRTRRRFADVSERCSSARLGSRPVAVSRRLTSCYGLSGVGVTIGLAVLLVKVGTEAVEAGPGDRPAGNWDRQLVGLPAVAQIGGAQ